jgi:hypothetical protein
MYQLAGARAQEALGHGLNGGPLYHCVQRLHEDFNISDAAVRCAMLVSIDCVGFMIPLAVLQKARYVATH